MSKFIRVRDPLDELNEITATITSTLEKAGILVEIEHKYSELDGDRLDIHFVGRLAKGKAKRSRSKLDQEAGEARGQAGEEEGRQELTGVEGPRTTRRRSFQRAATLARQ